jgi:hypothetical protein
MIDQSTTQQQWHDAAREAMDATLQWQRAHHRGDTDADEMHRVAQEKVRLAREAEQRHRDTTARENRRER